MRTVFLITTALAIAVTAWFTLADRSTPPAVTPPAITPEPGPVPAPEPPPAPEPLSDAPPNDSGAEPAAPPKAAPADDALSPEAVERALKRKMSLSIQDEKLGEVIGKIVKETGLRIRTSAQIANSTVTLSVNDLSAKDALTLLAMLAGGNLEVGDDGVIEIR